jgi:hypothetical protein
MAIKISDALIGLVLVGGIVSLFVIVMADGANTYSNTFDSSKYDQFNQTLSSVQNLAMKQNSSSQTLTAQVGLDWLGGLFTSAWSSFKLTAQAGGFFTELIGFGLSNIGLSDLLIGILKTVFGTIILITITFILYRMIMKENV